MAYVQNNFCVIALARFYRTGFNISISVADTDTEESFDTVTNSGKNLCEYPITTEIRKSCKLSNQKWKQELEKMEQEGKKNETRGDG